MQRRSLSTASQTATGHRRNCAAPRKTTTKTAMYMVWKTACCALQTHPATAHAVATGSAPPPPPPALLALALLLLLPRPAPSAP